MKVALIIIGAALLALASVFLIFNAIWPAPPPGDVKTGITPSAPPQRGPDIGRGNPGEPCATNRLGESFEFNGITYTCSGPKPYRWRAEK